ncbi:MAG TPA: carbohydrate kinase, partial [Chitinophagaceae bacterium]|nr:carbohydrate kinase [Chitinophagaceae bacterium]
MSSLPVIAIIDIGKTNKKIFLYDRDYHIVWEQTIHLPEVQDEDGDPVEDIHALTHWVTSSLHTVMENKAFDIKA